MRNYKHAYHQILYAFKRLITRQKKIYMAWPRRTFTSVLMNKKTKNIMTTLNIGFRIELGKSATLFFNDS